MRLFYSDASPYARTVRMVISEAELHERVTLLNSHPFENEVELLTTNPLAKVPCLVSDDHGAVFDSEVICQYLDERFYDGKLWQPIAQQWSLRTVYSLTSGLLDTCVALQQENMRRKDNEFSEFWWQRFVTALDRGLIELSKALPHLPESFSMLHINTMALLGYLDFRHPTVDWRDNIHLKTFFSTFEDRHSFLETAPQ